MDPLFLVVALGAALAGFVQGLSGFAFAMVASAVWAWWIDPQLVAAMAVFGGFSGQLLAALTVRRGFDLGLLLPFVAGGLAGIPVGVGILPLLNVDLFKLALGGLLVVICPVMLLAHRLPRVRGGGRLADAAAGFAGGVLGGIGGVSGAIPTLWCTLRGMPKDTQRAVIQNFNLGMLGVTLASYIGTGVITTATLPMLAIVLPAMLIPTLLGARLYIGISEAAFRRIVLGLLTASGVAMLAAAVPKLV
ncbi:sulfite exporter TauE/SafE family protein [Ferrovibrio terrae]|uniref:Probable membrane transporter protein n=1 Tax=Ferrovibrio terrae TaxID=2594003 RepID=A0A516H3F2_9PROT|nr:sulfite exporter TauE/SafE family protein [Ferrovibrio terrae]QDO98306.1 sulfite exporter TauE/SafE family protein [Ferrovibrio terrae]